MDEWLNIFSSDQKKNSILMAIMAGHMVGIIYNENIISSLDDKEGVVSCWGHALFQEHWILLFLIINNALRIIKFLSKAIYFQSEMP